MDVPADEIKMGEEAMSIGDAVIPLLADGSAFIPYQGGRTVKQREEGGAYEPFYRYIPYHDLIASKDLRESGQEPLLPDNAFKDKIVLVTIAAAGLSDLRATPFSPVSPGVEIHANIIDAVLSKRSLKTINPTLEKIYSPFSPDHSADLPGLWRVRCFRNGLGMGIHWRTCAGPYRPS